VDLFSPIREAARAGGLAGIDGQAESDSNFHLIPEFGYNKMINPDMSLGVTVYANGGMNTDYPGGQIPSGTACGPATGPGTGFNPAPGPYNLLCGNGSLGVDLAQLVIAPTLAYKITPNHAFGISPLIGIQSFEAQGLQAFAGFSTSPNDLTNKGHDTAYGYGVRVGWFGRLSEAVSVGAASVAREASTWIASAPERPAAVPDSRRVGPSRMVISAWSSSSRSKPSNSRPCRLAPAMGKGSG